MAEPITLTKGKDGEFTFFLNDQKGRPISIVGQTFVKLTLPGTVSGSPVELFAPLVVGLDEIQTITPDATPDSGTWKLQFKNKITTALAFNAGKLAVENALNALNELSSVTVDGSMAAGYTVNFVNNDGKRSQPLLLVVESDLKIGASDVTLTVIATTEGKGANGITVVDENCTELKINVSEDELASMKTGDNLDMDLTVRIGPKDLNIPPILGRLCVKESSL